MRLALIAAAALTLAAATSASATTWDAVADFTAATNGTGGSVWSYGWNDHSAPGFQKFTQNGECITGGLACWQSNDPQFFVPLIAKNTTLATLNYLTVVQPIDVLNLHPGGTNDGSVAGGADIDTILRFTAPTAGNFNFNGFFEALDTSPTGVTIFAGGHLVSISGFAAHPETTGAPTAFNFNTLLAQGGVVDFVVNRVGSPGGASYGNDSTGLALSVSVPEPATWGLMIMGFGGIGAMLRSNRRRAVVATA